MSARPLSGRIEHFFGFSFGSRTMMVIGKSLMSDQGSSAVSIKLVVRGAAVIRRKRRPIRLVAEKNVNFGKKMRNPDCVTLRLVYNKLNLLRTTPVQKEQHARGIEVLFGVKLRAKGRQFDDEV